MADFNLQDIPDLSSVVDAVSESEPFANGYYEGQILEKREFVDRNGNDRVFESSDTPSAKGDSRNIRLQITLKRQSDGKVLNTSTLINYKPDALSADTIQQIAAQQAKVKEGGEWGDLFGPFMTLTRLAKLQKIAGVRQLQRSPDGGLDLTPLYGKTAWFRIADDTRNPQYKEVKDFQTDKPKRAPQF